MKPGDENSLADHFSTANRLCRYAWHLVWLLLFRPSPIPFYFWRSFLLRCFGAKIGRKVHVYPSARVSTPWHLEMDDYSSLGRWVDCYCVGPVRIGRRSTISQYSYLCAGSHDIRDPRKKYTRDPIRIDDDVWVAVDAFIGPGVTLGEGAVVGARAAVFKDVKPWTVVGGNPARVIGKRKLRPAKHAKGKP